MKETLVIVADLGHLKAFRIREGELERKARLEPVAEHFQPGAHERTMDINTDSAGRFPKGARRGMGSNSDGERHNTVLEKKKRLVRELAQQVNRLAADGVDRCYIAVSREILNPLIDELNPQVQAKVEKKVAADLTRLETHEILERF